MEGLFVGMAGGGAERCLNAVADAVRKAKHPGRLAFGVCPRDNVDPSLFFKAAGRAALRLMPGDGLSAAKAWQTVYGLYGGQKFALQLTPEAVFSQDWDELLSSALSRVEPERALITGAFSADGSPRALAVQGFSTDGGLIAAPGMKIVRAQRPLDTMLLNPGFVFGKGEWMRLAREGGLDGTSVLALSLNAFSAGFQAYANHLPAFESIPTAPLPPERLPEGELSVLAPEFEEAAGIRFGAREADARARLGVYTPDGRYPVQLSLADGLRQYAKRRRETSISRVMLATALGKAPGHLPLDMHLMMFQNMAELKRLSLCCYCLPDRLKRMQKILPNTYARREAEGELPSFSGEDAFLRSKPHFIAEAAAQFPAHSHYGWIDMDYIKHPVYENAVFLWDNLTDDKIHLASVNGTVDAGLVIVPRARVDWLVETADVLSPDPSMGPGDVGLFKCLTDTYPDAFVIHPMDRRHMLLSQCQPMISGGMLYDA